MRWFIAGGLALSLLPWCANAHAQSTRGTPATGARGAAPSEDYLLLTWTPPSSVTKPAASANQKSDAPTQTPPKAFPLGITGLAPCCPGAPSCPCPCYPAAGCEAPCCPKCRNSANCRQFWLQGDALLWWIKDSELPPLVTTSPRTSLGVLGAPGTRVLAGGNTGNDARYGGRFTAGFWVDDCRTWGAETTFLFLGQRLS